MISPDDTAAHKAIELVYGDRPQEYGHPADVYAKVAPLWSAYLGIELSIEDIPMMMALFKMGREMNRHKDDNLVDAIGYLLVLERVQKRMRGEE